MMKLSSTLAWCIVLAPTLAFAVDAPKESCSGIQWNTAFLKDYPEAPAACREVTIKDGVKYAKFDGKVSKVSKQLVQAQISDVANTPISTIAFQVGVGGRVTMGGKEIKVGDLKVGDTLTFWIREGQFGVSPTLTDQPMTIIKPEAMTAS